MFLDMQSILPFWAAIMKWSFSTIVNEPNKNGISSFNKSFSYFLNKIKLPSLSTRKAKTFEKSIKYSSIWFAKIFGDNMAIELFSKFSSFYPKISVPLTQRILWGKKILNFIYIVLLNSKISFFYKFTSFLYFLNCLKPFSSWFCNGYLAIEWKRLC